MKKQSPKPQTEAEAFTNLARKLLAVPKKEVDEKKVGYQKQKEREKGKRTT